MTIGIIIARGGSKRLPRKNVKMFCGHPLVAWSIVQSKCSHLIDETVLSTDDDEIAEIGETYGARIIRRPDWPDADLVSANRPFSHAMQVMLDECGDDFDTVVTFLPTSPIREPGDMDRGVELFKRLGLLEVQPIIPRRETFYYRITHKLHCRTAFFDKGYNYASQGGNWGVTNPRHYIEFVGNMPDLDAELDRIGKTDLQSSPRLEVSYVTIPIWQACEVDTAEEFEFAEIIMEHYVLKGRSMEVYYEYRDG